MTISACATQTTFAPHPDLDIPLEPELLPFTREMLDCSEPERLDLCKRIKRRELSLLYYIETLQLRIIEHNRVLSPDSP